MKRYIKSYRLDTNRLKSSADASRAKHLFNLMDEQDSAAQKDYTTSTERYRKGQIYALADKYRKEFENAFREITLDVHNAKDEYGLIDKGIWGFVSEALYSMDIRDMRGEALTIIIYEYNDYVHVRIKAPDCEPEIAEIGVTCADDYPYGGDPDVGLIALHNFNAYKFCDAVYSAYEYLFQDYDIDAMYKFGLKMMDMILKPIEDAVTKGIEKCLYQNPPPLE